MFANKKCSRITKFSRMRNAQYVPWYDLPWPCSAYFDIVQLFVVFCGILWPFYGLLWQNIAVIDPNSFDLVLIH